MESQTMFKLKLNFRRLLAAGLFLSAMAGCQVTPDEKQLDEWKNLEGPGEMKPGPGLFSGQDGELTLYDSKKGGLLQKKGEAEAAKPATEKTAQTNAAAGAATAAGTSDEGQEFQEFQEYQQWKKEKQEFHEYQE